MKVKHQLPSIFGGKVDGSRYQGVVSVAGSIRVEAMRDRLAKLAGRLPEQTSDGDVLEYLARGEKETQRIIGQGR